MRPSPPPSPSPRTPRETVVGEALGRKSGRTACNRRVISAALEELPGVEPDDLLAQAEADAREAARVEFQ
jgi:hypothetical protein